MRARFDSEYIEKELERIGDQLEDPVPSDLNNNLRPTDFYHRLADN